MKHRTYIGQSEVFCSECKRLVNPLVTVLTEYCNRGHGEYDQEETELVCSACGSEAISDEYGYCDDCDEYYDKCETHDCPFAKMDASIETINQLTKQIGR